MGYLDSAEEYSEAVKEAIERAGGIRALSRLVIQNGYRVSPTQIANGTAGRSA